MTNSERRRVAFDNHLRQAVAVADVEKHQRTHVADAVHPAEQDDVLANVGETKGATGVRASEGSELFSHYLNLCL